MRYIVALLLALVAITGFAAAMTAPTTSNATKFLATPLNEGVPTTKDTPTTLGYSGLLTMPLTVGVPTGSFVTGISGNWEAPVNGINTPPNWAEVIAGTYDDGGATDHAADYGFSGYS